MPDTLFPPKKPITSVISFVGDNIDKIQAMYYTAFLPIGAIEVNKYYHVALNKVISHVAKVVAVNKVKFDAIPDGIAYASEGMCANDLRIKLRSMYEIADDMEWGFYTFLNQDKQDYKLYQITAIPNINFKR